MRTFKEYLEEPFIEKGIKKALEERFRVTRRESEVLYWYFRGYSTLDIADKLGISFRTARSNVYWIYKKVNKRLEQEGKPKLPHKDIVSFYHILLVLPHFTLPVKALPVKEGLLPVGQVT